MGKLLRFPLQRLLRADQVLLGALACGQNAFRILHRNRAEQLFLVVVHLHYLPAIISAARAVPSTRARIFSKAVSRLVEMSSQKGENPQSSVVPSCSIGIYFAASRTRSRTCSGVSTCGSIGATTPTKIR